MGSEKLGEAINEMLNSEPWDKISKAIDGRLSENPTEVIPHVQLIFTLLSTLLYAKYRSEEQRIGIEKKLVGVFRDSRKRFCDNPEFLFFAGFLSAISFWFFELDNEAESHAMLRRSFELEPDNPLFKWGYLFSTGSPEASKAGAKLVTNPFAIRRLQSFGPPGEYVLETLRNVTTTFPSDIA